MLTSYARVLEQGGAMTGQDAAKRAEGSVGARLWVEQFGGRTEYEWIIPAIDAAVAEAVKDAEERHLRHASYYEEALREARREERVEIAHRIRLIFRDAATFYEIKEALSLADELDPDEGPTR